MTPYPCANVQLSVYAVTGECISRRAGIGYFDGYEGTALISIRALTPQVLRLFWNPIGEQKYKVTMSEIENGPPTIQFITGYNEVDVNIKPNQIYYITLQVIYGKCLSIPYRFTYKPKI